MQITVSDLSNIHSPIIIDIRTREKYNNHHIDHAINIPYSELILKPSKYLSFSKTYYIYCEKGYTSYRLVMLLNQMGYKTYSIKGGYEQWVLEK